MTTTGEGKIDPNQFKGILPAHMRQGIPPYLQILFAARPKLPFLPVTTKPHKIIIQGFFENLDYKKMLELSKQSKEEKEILKPDEKIPETSLKTFNVALVKKQKQEDWTRKIAKNLQTLKEEYKNWIKEKDINNGNKTKDPKNTLIISKLVV